MLKGQTSIEFLSYSIVFIVALSVVFVITSFLLVENITVSQRVFALSIAERVSYAISAIYSSPPGSYYVVDLPPSIGGVDYNLSFVSLKDGNFVMVEYVNGNVLSFFEGKVVGQCDSNVLVFYRDEDVVRVRCG